jgi:hypothetical protein
MSSSLFVVLCVVVLCSFAEAHICAITPRQRGAFGIETPGDNSCFHRIPQCGNILPESPKVTYTPNQEVKLLFQQNLNHWNDAKPGFLDVAISLVPETNAKAEFVTLVTLQDYPAHDQVTKTNFTAIIKLPGNVLSHTIA